MIGDVLLLLRDRLDAHLRAALPGAGAESAQDQVQLIDGEKTDPISFHLNAITLLLINIEQDTSQRNADPYLRAPADGLPRRLQPDIRLNLHLLFVARYKVYAQGLNQLAQVIRFVQQWPALDPANTPALSPQIHKLVLELVTLPLAEFNEIWSALRVSCQPAVMLRLRMVVLRDALGAAVPPITDTELRTRQRL